MLTKVELQDVQGNLLALSLTDNSNGYTVKNIDGLDPVKATIVSAPFAQIDGAQYQGARREPRNIVMTIGLEPYSGGSTVETLRNALYAFAMPKSYVTLRFFKDGAGTPSQVITGMVETNEAPYFAKDPEAVISIMCFDPSFSAFAATDITTGWNTVNIGAAGANLTYPGTIDTGMRLVLNVNRVMSSFSIVNVRAGVPDERMDVTLALAISDKVEINTNDRTKYITRAVGAGAPASVLYAMSVNSKWPRLYPGVNTLRIEHSAGAAVPFEIHYTAKYGGL